MRLLVTFLALGLCSTACLAQKDSTLGGQSPVSSQKQVLIPGIDSPTSAPGTLMQSSPQPNVQPAPQNGRRKRRTTPPADPRAFGVGIPVGKAKKDTLQR